jgi:glycosyltransferase involved in cell wall biosynthesis
MPLLIDIAGWLLLACSAAVLAYWAVVGWHVLRTVRLVPTCRDGLRLEEAERLRAGGPRVCVVVPAHNEAGCIGTLTRSLLRQDYPDLRVVFALDRCTDGTLDEIAKVAAAEGGGALAFVRDGRTPIDARVQIVTVESCPEGVAGKVNAMVRGVEDAPAARDADVLLFVDADTELHPSCVRAALALLRERGLGMLSLLSTLTTDRWFERVVQPAAGMELLRQYPLVRAGARTHRRPFANGQFMMFTRGAYEAVGGHTRVGHALLEDVELAREVGREGIPAGLFLADAMLHCRMYDRWDAFVAGWKRIYGESANRRVSRLRGIAWRLRAVGTAGPMLAAAGLAVGVLGRGAGIEGPWLAAVSGAAVAMNLGVLAACYRLSRAPLVDVLAYPAGAWLVARILDAAAEDLENRVPTRWAGREYVREPR